jgi:organic radical activating enzyme
MVSKVRLLITRKCFKNCSGCCMKDWKETIKSVTLSALSNYREVYITGGEPMLFPIQLALLIRSLKVQAHKVYLYTALPYPKHIFIPIMDMLDGASITLHDVNDFRMFNLSPYHNMFKDKSMRLNDFNLSEYSIKCADNWDVRKKIWLKDCPLPDGEDFVQLNNFMLE